MRKPYTGVARATAALLACLAPALPASAAPLLTDRPSMTTGPLTLAPGILQLEAGSGFATGKLPAVRHELAQRFGLVPGWEFRLRTPMAITGLEVDSRVALGAKAQFLEGYLLSLGGLASLELSPRANPSFQGALLATLGLPRGFALTLNAGPVLATHGADWMGAAELGYDSGDLWRVFGEVARVHEDGGASVAAGAGLGVRVSEHASWDVSVFRGLAPEAPDWAFTSGFAFRWGAD